MPERVCRIPEFLFIENIRLFVLAERDIELAFLVDPEEPVEAGAVEEDDLCCPFDPRGLEGRIINFRQGLVECIADGIIEIFLAFGVPPAEFFVQCPEFPDEVFQRVLDHAVGKDELAVRVADRALAEIVLPGEGEEDGAPAQEWFNVFFYPAGFEFFRQAAEEHIEELGFPAGPFQERAGLWVAFFLCHERKNTCHYDLAVCGFIIIAEVRKDSNRETNCQSSPLENLVAPA